MIRHLVKEYKTDELTYEQEVERANNMDSDDMVEWMELEPDASFYYDNDTNAVALHDYLMTHTTYPEDICDTITGFLISDVIDNDDCCEDALNWDGYGPRPHSLRCKKRGCCEKARLYLGNGPRVHNYDCPKVPIDNMTWERGSERPGLYLRNNPDTFDRAEFADVPIKRWGMKMLF